MLFLKTFISEHIHLVNAISIGFDVLGCICAVYITYICENSSKSNNIEYMRKTLKKNNYNNYFYAIFSIYRVLKYSAYYLIGILEYLC